MRIVALFILAAGLFGLGGCSSSEPEDPNRVSTMPWNVPQGWEGQGPLGSFMGAQ